MPGDKDINRSGGQQSKTIRTGALAFVSQEALRWRNRSGLQKNERFSPRIPDSWMPGADRERDFGEKPYWPK